MFGLNNNNGRAPGSVLGKKYTGIRATASYYGGPPNNLSSAPALAPSEAPINSAPLTAEDIPRILEILEPCPTGSYALRVFQQHPEGLCWQDSLFIMFYNQDWFRPFLMETAAFYLEEFLRQGQTDLKYAGTKKVIQKNYSNRVPENTPYNERPNIEVEKKNLPVKIIPIAAQFAERYRAMGLPLKFWEYYALQLNRYILLAYLFLKYPDTATIAKPMAKSTALASRRKSISAANYGQLALNYKEYVFRQFDVGMYCHNFKEGRRWFEILTKAVSGNGVSLIDYTTPGIAPETILGYYIIIHSSTSSTKHIVSLFKCRGQWVLYDIDVGVVEFSPEGSANLSSSKMTNLLIENQKDRGVFEYTVTLEDAKTVQSELPSQFEYAYKLDKFYGGSSFMLVEGDIAAKAENSPPTGFFGGGRRRRLTRKSRRRSTRRNRTRK